MLGDSLHTSGAAGQDSHQMSARQTQLYQSTVNEVLKPKVHHTPFQEQSISNRLEFIRNIGVKREKRNEMKALYAEAQQKINEEV